MNNGSELLLLGKFDVGTLQHFYKLKWMTAMSLDNATNWGNLDLCLARIRSDWIVGLHVGSHFFIKFDTPSVQVLCPHEVILSFHLGHLALFAQREEMDNA